MIAMTKPHLDSFLPSGAAEPFVRSIAPIAHFDGHPNSVISPLALPQPLKQRSSYFDSVASRKLSPPSHALSSSHPRSPSPRGHLSPHYEFPLTSKTLGSTAASPSMSSSNFESLSPLNYLSPEASTTLLQRREEYIRRSQESWLAERAHLEASRARAEDMLQEERRWMDEERRMWVQDKITGESEIERWRQKAQAADKEVARLTTILRNAGLGVGSPIGGLNGIMEGAGATHPPVPRDAGRNHSGSGSSTYGSPGAVGQSSIMYRSPSNCISPATLPHILGSTVPESNPFVPLDPRMQGSTPPENISPTERIPSIDVHEVIPGLEGIRLKAPAIQKSTFNEERPLSSNPGSNRGSPPNSRKGSAEAAAKPSPLKMAQQALRAPEHHRLTMHAGHTPNHSVFLSRPTTVQSTAVNTAGSSGTSTPTRLEEEVTLKITDEQDQLTLVKDHEEQTDPFAQQVLGDANLDEEVLLEPSDDDPALKGPLCLRNRPAADEIFLRRLSDKLEEVKANDATPSVLSEPATSDIMEDSTNLQPGVGGGDGVPDDDHNQDSIKDIEQDIPLKLKKSNNFGQPFGQAQSGFNF